MSDDQWPFSDVRRTAVFTTRQVMEDGDPITHVSHDADDGAWQFHGPKVWNVKDAKGGEEDRMRKKTTSAGEILFLPVYADNLRHQAELNQTRGGVALGPFANYND